MNDIESFFEEYRTAWDANSAAQIESFWDTSAPAPFYKAEEVDSVFSSWTDLRTYWQHNEGFNDAIDLTFSEHQSQPLEAGRVLVAMRMHWDIKFSADATLMDGSAFAWAGQSMGGENHVISMLKQVANGWKLTAWIEAPNAPISYIADLYMKNVRPGFPG